MTETFRPACAASPTSGPAMATAKNAGISVISGASSDRKIISSKTRIKITDRPSTWFPWLPDLACWSTLIAIWPARFTCNPAGAAAVTIFARMFFTSVVWSGWLAWLTSDSTCSCSPCWSADRPRSRTETTVGTVARSCRSVASQVVSAVLSVPPPTAATT
jgi:hypothetical protein